MWEGGWSSFWDLKSCFPESCSLPGDLAQGDENLFQLQKEMAEWCFASTKALNVRCLE